MNTVRQDTTASSGATAVGELRRANQKLRAQLEARRHRVGVEDDSDYDSRGREGARQGVHAHARPSAPTLNGTEHKFPMWRRKILAHLLQNGARQVAHPTDKWLQSAAIGSTIFIERPTFCAKHWQRNVDKASTGRGSETCPAHSLDGLGGVRVPVPGGDCH